MPAEGSGEVGRRGRRHPAVLVGGGVLAALALGVVGGVVGALLVAGTPGTPSADGSGACDGARVAARALPAIVTISATGSGAGTGSGAILTGDGAVVTNDHVITPAVPDGRIEVMLASGERLPATLVGRDPQTDLAVLDVEPGRALPTIEVGSSDGLSVGEPVVALGAPLGLSSTVTAGIVSATGRSVTVPTGVPRS